MQLLKIETNELLRIVQKEGIDPNHLQLVPNDKHGLPVSKFLFFPEVIRFSTEDDQRAVNEIYPSRIAGSTRLAAMHLPGLYFHIAKLDNDVTSFILVRTKLEHAMRNRPIVPPMKARWDRIVYWFDQWVRLELKRYVAERSEPDLWQLLQNQTDFYPSSVGGNDRFTRSETDHIREGLRKFDILLAANYNETPDQSSEISAKLEHLSDLLDKMTKTDWKGIAISTVFGIAATLSLTPDRISAVFQLLQEAMVRGAQLLH
jgi:hypothetical protein